jgi:hypothetical protein
LVSVIAFMQAELHVLAGSIIHTRERWAAVVAAVSGGALMMVEWNAKVSGFESVICGEHMFGLGG